MGLILRTFAALVLLAPACVFADQDRPAPTTATIVEIMNGMVMPAANILWKATAVHATEDGIVDYSPKNDEEWHKVQQARIEMSKAIDLLLIPGRRVGVPGAVEFAEQDLTPDQIEALIKREPDQWMELARALEETMQQAKTAIENHDVEALRDIGAAIDDACEGCHLHFWYPEQ